MMDTITQFPVTVRFLTNPYRVPVDGGFDDDEICGVYVIDRADGKIKILKARWSMLASVQRQSTKTEGKIPEPVECECGTIVSSQYCPDCGKDIGAGQEHVRANDPNRGHDFRIDADGRAAILDRTPITEAEKDAIRAQRNSGEWVELRDWVMVVAAELLEQQPRHYRPSAAFDRERTLFGERCST